jgi:Ca2+-binding EF-hand superfamily protein
MDPAIEESITRSVLGKTKLNGEEIEVMKEMFKFYDTDNDGHLTREQASSLFAELGYTGDHWSQKRVPMEAFLLKCGAEKKCMLEDSEDTLEANSLHIFNIMDQPRTGTVNKYKLKSILSEIEMDITDDRIERIAELIASSDEPEFTEYDLHDYIRNNLRMSQGMQNARDEEAEGSLAGSISLG